MRQIAAGLALAIPLLAAEPQGARAQAPCPSGVLVGQAVLASGWKQDSPGVCREITKRDLPPPATPNPDPPNIIARPAGATLKLPAGFTATLAYQDTAQPEIIRTAPNGDLFVSESGAGQIRVLRPNGQGGFSAAQVFAVGLTLPYGLAFYPPGAAPQFLYVADTDRVYRFPYANGDLVATGAAQTVVATLPSGGNHVSRDVVFSADGARMLVSVGSSSNDLNNGETETNRADILSFAPDGTGQAVYASGIRNPFALAFEPRSGALWTSVNERDDLGDNLVPDFIAYVSPGAFFGWPWYYIGNHVDPRHTGDAPPEASIKVPELLLESHSASLGLAFYTATLFPKRYRHGAFVAEHGSWDRGYRNGSKVIFVAAKPNGTPQATYEDFMTGFTVADASTTDGSGTWGRPVGVAMGNDGSLYVSDDVGNRIWRITY